MSNNPDKKTRLQKIIADCGYCSRRKAEEFILQGKVFVNGEKITQLGSSFTEDDIIKVNGKTLKKSNKKIYILLNKPVGVVTTAEDEQGRTTVIDLISGEISERLFPVGRLDIATSGALILTNDGEFTYNLTHPKHNIPKTYEAIINKEITEKEMNILQNGVVIDDKKTSPCEIKMLTEKILQITIHEGRNRQIRKMFEAIDKKVLELKRIQIGNITLGNLPLGRFRRLSPAEIASFAPASFRA